MNIVNQNNLTGLNIGKNTIRFDVVRSKLLKLIHIK